MSFFEYLLSNISSVLDGDNPNYGSWSSSLITKVEEVHSSLDPLVEKGGEKSLAMVQDLLGRLHPSLVELLPDLDIEIFSGDLRNTTQQQSVRGSLVRLWAKLLQLLDKLTEMRYIVLCLDVIYRISVRTEFDCENLSSKPSSHLEEFRKYHHLLHSTYRHLRIRLAELKLTPAAASWSYQLDLPQAYAKILVMLFFRLPEATADIIKACEPPSCSYNLEDYHFFLNPDADGKNNCPNENGHHHHHKHNGNDWEESARGARGYSARRRGMQKRSTKRDLYPDAAPMPLTSELKNGEKAKTIQQPTTRTTRTKSC